jgi:micrococcal nuclease
MVRSSSVFFLIVICAVACSPSSDPADVDQQMSAPNGTPATVAHVFDGDSIEVEIEGRTEEIRMIGINAPESDECFGERARDALIGYLEGKDIGLVGGSDVDVDQYGRRLRYVYVGAENINGRMLADGNAVTLQGDHTYNEAFVELGNLAATAGYGMWAPDACGPPPAPGMSIAEVQYNPPGPDDEHLNDEYVTIVNEGEAAIDVTGWTLRDESSQNRYVFGDVTLAPGDGVTIRTGCGTERPGTLSWCSDRSIWSNSGDTVMLLDAHGNIADWWTYRD